MKKILAIMVLALVLMVVVPASAQAATYVGSAWYNGHQLQVEVTYHSENSNYWHITQYRYRFNPAYGGATSDFNMVQYSGYDDPDFPNTYGSVTIGGVCNGTWFTKFTWSNGNSFNSPTMNKIHKGDNELECWWGSSAHLIPVHNL